MSEKSEDSKDETKIIEKEDEIQKISESIESLLNDSIYNVNKYEHYEKLISTGLVVIDFTAIWCGPCKQIAPKFHELAKEHTNIKFVKVDIDQVDDVMRSKVMDFNGVPTFRFFKDGELVKELFGANLKKIKLGVDNLLGKSALKKSLEEIIKDSIYCVTEYSHYELLIKSGLVVLYFMQSDYEPCDEIEPNILELAKIHENIKFIKLDVDEVEEEVHNKVKGPRNLPTFRFLRDGLSIKETRGGDLSNIKKNIEILLGNLSEIEEPKPIEELLENSIYNVSEYFHYKKLISTGLVVIDFTAIWCGPCKQIAPKFHELALEHTSIKFVKVDIDKIDEEMEDKVMDFDGVPTFRFFKDGELVKEFSGANIEELQENVEYLAKNSSDSKESNLEAKKMTDNNNATNEKSN